MFKRLFWLLTGFAWGIGASWFVVRSVKRTVRRTVETYAPARLASRAGHGYRAVRVNVRAAWAEGREAMRAREAELWEHVESSRIGAVPDATHAATPEAAPASVSTRAAAVSPPVADELAARRRRPFAAPVGKAGTRR
ncbi:MAG: hypothetical protein JOZ99_02235 [Actinobacteria bacterium]|nr:hypothetical protein [Actinomycetota bacterium]